MRILRGLLSYNSSNVTSLEDEIGTLLCLEALFGGGVANLVNI